MLSFLPPLFLSFFHHVFFLSHPLFIIFSPSTLSQEISLTLSFIFQHLFLSYALYFLFCSLSILANPLFSHRCFISNHLSFFILLSHKPTLFLSFSHHLGFLSHPLSFFILLPSTLSQQLSLSLSFFQHLCFLFYPLSFFPLFSFLSTLFSSFCHL